MSANFTCLTCMNVGDFGSGSKSAVSTLSQGLVIFLSLSWQTEESASVSRVLDLACPMALGRLSLAIHGSAFIPTKEKAREGGKYWISWILKSKDYEGFPEKERRTRRLTEADCSQSSRPHILHHRGVKKYYSHWSRDALSSVWGIFMVKMRCLQPCLYCSSWICTAPVFWQPFTRELTEKMSNWA